MSRTDTDLALLRKAGISDDQLAALSEKELLYLEACLNELAETGESPTAASMVMEDYRWAPVSMEQFLADPAYMGEIAKGFYPAVKGLLIESFDVTPRPTTIIVSGAIGWGKSVAAQAMVTYLAYRLTCLRDPHSFYKLAKGKNIFIALYSLNLDQALDGIYGGVLRWVDTIPYFSQRCPRVKRVNTTIKFSGTAVEIIPASRMEHTIGRDIFAAVIDEANFITAHGGSGGEEVAEAIYNSVERRRESRFMGTGGEVAGMMVIASSRASKVSFVEAKTQALHKELADGSAKLYAFAQWEVKPAANYTKPRFRVEVGDRLHPSRILKDGEDPANPRNVIHVPGEYRDSFIKDIDKALRELAGVATESMTPLFHDKSAIRRGMQAGHEHPFSRQEIVLDIRDDVGLESYFLPEKVFRVVQSRYELRLNPQAARYIQVDIGWVKDSLGISMVHVPGYKVVKRERSDGTWYHDKAPRCVPDFYLRVRPPLGGEIDIGKVRAFILSLRDYGVPIWRVGYDIQGKGEVQTLKKLGFDAVEYSVDKTDDAYMALKQAYIEDRVEGYYYRCLETELCDLERNLDKRTVDHPSRASDGEPGHKDVADSLAGAYYLAMTDKRLVPADGVAVPYGGRPGRVERRIPVHGGSFSWSDLDKELRR